MEQWNQLNGDNLKRPTLLLQAESDPYMNPAAVAELFQQIAAKDKQWIILANADHPALLETSRLKLYHAVVSFLRKPLNKSFKVQVKNYSAVARHKPSPPNIITDTPLLITGLLSTVYHT